MAHEPDESTREIIQRLCLEAGRLMEDNSPGLAMTLPRNSAEIGVQLTQLRQIGEDIIALAAAAQALHARVSAMTE